MARETPCPKCGSTKVTDQHDCGEYTSDDNGGGSWACMNYKSCHYCGHDFAHDPPKDTTPRVIDPITRDWESLVRKYKKGGIP